MTRVLADAVEDPDEERVHLTFPELSVDLFDLLGGDLGLFDGRAAVSMVDPPGMVVVGDMPDAERDVDGLEELGYVQGQRAFVRLRSVRCPVCQ